MARDFVAKASSQTIIDLVRSHTITLLHCEGLACNGATHRRRPGPGACVDAIGGCGNGCAAPGTGDEIREPLVVETARYRDIGVLGVLFLHRWEPATCAAIGLDLRLDAHNDVEARKQFVGRDAGAAGSFNPELGFLV